jgi:hypothetical protein
MVCRAQFGVAMLWATAAIGGVLGAHLTASIGECLCWDGSSRYSLACIADAITHTLCSLMLYSFHLAGGDDMPVVIALLSCMLCCCAYMYAFLKAALSVLPHRRCRHACGHHAAQLLLRLRAVC